MRKRAGARARRCAEDVVVNDDKPDLAGVIDAMRLYLETARFMHELNAHAADFQQCGHPACLHTHRVEEWLGKVGEGNKVEKPEAKG